MITEIIEDFFLQFDIVFLSGCNQVFRQDHKLLFLREYNKNYLKVLAYFFLEYDGEKVEG